MPLRRWHSTGGIGEYAKWEDVPKEVQAHLKSEDGYATQIGEYFYKVLNWDRKNRGGYSVFRYTTEEWVKRPATSDMFCRRCALFSTLDSEANLCDYCKNVQDAVVTKNDGINAELFVKYRNRIATKRKIFTKDDRNSVVTTVLSSDILDNTLSIDIEIVSGRHFTRTISGGNYDYLGGIDSGYSVTGNFASVDEYLMKIFIKTMRERRFACTVSNYSANCFLQFRNPTVAGQRELLNDVCKQMVSRISPDATASIQKSPSGKLESQNVIGSTTDAEIGNKAAGTVSLIQQVGQQTASAKSQKCLSCNNENSSDASTCSYCGKPIDMKCSNCRHSNPPQSRFCNQCGAMLQIG